jgi:hypothetical protein
MIPMNSIENLNPLIKCPKSVVAADQFDVAVSEAVLSAAKVALVRSSRKARLKKTRRKE